MGVLQILAGNRNATSRSMFKVGGGAAEVLATALSHFPSVAAGEVETPDVLDFLGG